MSAPQVASIHPRVDFALISEANHRVANHLSLLAGMVQFQASDIARGPAELTREYVHGVLKEVAGRVVSIGHLHRRLAHEPEMGAFDLGDYLIENSHAFIKSLALQGRVGIVQRIDGPCPAKADQAQPIALIVGEIIMNAIKHAHPTGIPVEISICCGRNRSGRIEVEVADDGIGFPEGFDPDKDGGLGLRLIRMLSATLKADLDIDSDSLGTRFRLTLPGTAG
jgi:two-component sensor histidine kinase